MLKAIYSLIRDSIKNMFNRLNSMWVSFNAKNIIEKAIDLGIAVGSVFSMPLIAATFSCSLLSDPNWHPTFQGLTSILLFITSLSLIYYQPLLGLVSVLLPISDLTLSFKHAYKRRLAADRQHSSMSAAC